MRKREEGKEREKSGELKKKREESEKEKQQMGKETGRKRKKRNGKRIGERKKEGRQGERGTKKLEEDKKRRGKKREKKLSTELNLGPLTLRGNGRYAYNSKGVMNCYSKMAWGEPSFSFTSSFLWLFGILCAMPGVSVSVRTQCEWAWYWLSDRTYMYTI